MKARLFSLMALRNRIRTSGLRNDAGTISMQRDFGLETCICRKRLRRRLERAGEVGKCVRKAVRISSVLHLSAYALPSTETVKAVSQNRRVGCVCSTWRKARPHDAVMLSGHLTGFGDAFRRAGPANRRRWSRPVAWKPQESSPMRSVVSGHAETAD